MKKNKKPAEKHSRPSFFERQTEINMLGSREIFVEGCRGIIDYRQEEILLSLGRSILKITGRDLNLRGMEDERVHICGDIHSVEFDR